MNEKFDWITSDRTALEIASRFAGSVSDTARAFELWAKMKHRDCRHEACDIASRMYWTDQTEEMQEEMVKYIMNIKF